MTRALHKSATYRADVVDAAEFGLEQFGARVCDAFLDSLANTERLIAEFPQIGTSLNFGATERNVRRPVIGSYNLIYFVQSDNVVLLRLIRQEREDQTLTTL
ncbi:MAG: type II toxin-antitoxin system RelE/ParE family toxin [Fimbriimonadaceae bacterium]